MQIVMTTSIVSSLQEHSTISRSSRANYQLQYCKLQWRRGQLLVKSLVNLQEPYLLALDNEELLIECLKHSPINLVTVDAKLGNAALEFWADACKEAKKPIFLSTFPVKKYHRKSHQMVRNIQRLIDWILALFLLLLVSPLMVVLALLMQVYSPGLLFSYEWHIGERGKLFQLIRFCRNGKHKITFLGFLMDKYGLDNLPKLFNVLRGDMSLIKYQLWSLEDGIRLSLEGQGQTFNTLPEVITSWEIKTKFKSAKLS
jgi:hypothetical protein